MAISELIAPCNKDHSIKEAVITVFLASPILKPSRFNKLIETELKDQFHQFNVVNSIALEIQGFPGKPASQSISKQDEMGFQFIGYENGKISRILQARNEDNRIYISFHSQNYTRWRQFYDDYIKSMTALSNNHPDMFVKAISLHYVDQFKWLGANPIDLSEIFKKGNDWFPNVFFTSEMDNYLILTKTKIDNIDYANRIEIKAKPNIKREIFISHNISRELEDIVDLATLLASNNFESTLEKEHNHNKNFLKNILTDPIQKMINLM